MIANRHMAGEWMFKKTIKIRNGNTLVNYEIYECNACGEEIEEAWPRYEDGNYHLCIGCAFKMGKIDDKTFLRFSGIGISNAHAAVNLNGEIEVWIGKITPPWKRNNKQQRNSPEYNAWRKSVFKRDEYTCQDCGQVGGELNAHHIKSFKRYPKLRLKQDNGITLCVSCHRKRHCKVGGAGV